MEKDKLLLTIFIICLLCFSGYRYYQSLPNDKCNKPTYAFEVPHGYVTYQQYYDKKDKDTIYNVCSYTIKQAPRNSTFYLEYREHIDGICVEKRMPIGNKVRPIIRLLK